MTARPFTFARHRLAGVLVLLSAVTCFTGEALVGQPCQTDDECNPSVDAFVEALRCEHGVCGYSQRCGDGIVDEAAEECDDGESLVGRVVLDRVGHAPADAIGDGAGFSLEKGHDLATEVARLPKLVDGEKRAARGMPRGRAEPRRALYLSGRWEHGQSPER